MKLLLRRTLHRSVILLSIIEFCSAADCPRVTEALPRHKLSEDGSESDLRFGYTIQEACYSYSWTIDCAFTLVN